ncbi:tetraacyldisaccharide 4'-kinase [Acetobacter fallax]|uniref:Tetraacyldisaccharide 4'-kinase n=1 Tax=Acetobacter fallax TaxID=1737473 RepID=A0ABX0KDM6_9PROT|nr:tetraacyldisaccharide 4'-kinase [Acetobacter fallax]NHO34115.1 tetraacyldisaccharide 4'-kinase [Acetobacter fallax]NHO37649.1 tetraacyldisaccharide 4'-kinase [Acetobacter fallax]
MRPPAFWAEKPGLLAALLQPAAWIVAHVAARRRATKGWRAPVPVLCCGNLTVGGTGKTTMVLDLAQRLQTRGFAVHILTRGYGGQAGQDGRPVLVDECRHSVRDVGDEALLLARAAPCWVGRDRVASARAAVDAGADCLLMDDGFQNPGLHKDVSLLLVDGVAGFGNECVMPAGPLREGFKAGLLAADMVVVTGEDKVDVPALIAGSLRANVPILQAGLLMDSSVETLRGQRLIAFAGLARPDKFFESLRACGVMPVHCEAFPDHHMFRLAELERMARLAAEMKAELVTTPKDAIRLPDKFRQRVKVVGVSIGWTGPSAPECILDRMFGLKCGEPA